METVTFKMSEQVVKEQQRMINYLLVVMPVLMIFFFWFTPSMRYLLIGMPPMFNTALFLFFILLLVGLKVLFNVVTPRQMAGLRRVEIILGPEGLERRKGEVREFFPFAEIERFIIVKNPRKEIHYIKLATRKARLVLFRLTNMEQLALLLAERLNPQVYRKTEQLRLDWSHPVVAIFSTMVALFLMAGFMTLLLGGHVLGLSLFGLPFIIFSGIYFPFFRPMSRTWGPSYRWRENLFGILSLSSTLFIFFLFPRFVWQEIFTNPCHFVTRTFQETGCVWSMGTEDSVAFLPDESTLAVTQLQTVWFQPVSSSPFYNPRPLYHDDFVRGFALAANGQRLASWSFEAVYLWDVSERTLIHEQAVENFDMVVLDSGGDRLGIVDFGGNVVQLWQTEPWQPVKVFTETHNMAFSPDGELIATFPRWGKADDAVVQMWDAEDLTMARSLTLPDGSNFLGWYVAFSPDGHWLAAADYLEATVHVWQVADGSWQYSWNESARVSANPAFSPTGDILAVGYTTDADHAYIQLWSLTDGSLLRSIPLGETLRNRPKSMAFSSDGSLLAVATGNRVMVFEMAKLLP